MLRFLLPALALLLTCGIALAHPSDVSQLRVKIRHNEAGFRFTMNLLTLSRIVVIDTNHDQRITPEEIQAAAPAVAAFLKSKVLISLNQDDADLGDFQGYDCVWPNSKVQAITDQKASQRFVDFTFAKPWPAGIQDLWIGFQIFSQVGDQHTVQALYQQEGQPEAPVDFSQQEPEYLYDTGWEPGQGSTPPAAATPKTPAPAPEPAASGRSWFWLGVVVVVVGGGAAGWRRRRKT